MPLAVLAFLTAVAYLPGITSAAYAPRWWVLLVGAPLVAMAARRAPPTTGHWLGILFLCAATESLFWSVSRMDTYNAIIQLVPMTLVFCVAAQQANLAPVWLALGAGAVPSVVVALVQTQTPWFVESKGIAGLFFQRDFFGSYCAVALVGLLYGVPRKTMAVWALVVVCAAGLLLSASRGALLATTCACAAMWVLGLPTLAKRLWAGLAVALLAIGACVAFYHFMPSRQAALDERFLEWDWVAQNLRWFGWGYNTLGSVFSFEHAENEYLELAFDLGVLSITFWAFVVYSLKGYKHAQGCAAVVITLLVNCATAFPLHNPATAMVAAICLGGLCGSRAGLRRDRRAGATGGASYSRAWRDSGRPKDLQRPAVSLPA